MDLRKLFTRELNYRWVNQPIDPALFTELTVKPSAATVMVEGLGVQVLRLTLPELKGEYEKACIRVLRKRYPDAVYLFANADQDTDKTLYHLCNVAGKQLPLSPQKQRLFREKVRFFEVTEDVTGTLDLKDRIAKAFDSEKVVKKFYTEFEKYHALLLKFITGIPLPEDQRWYASVLLNRLMFICFIQKAGLIGKRTDFLLDEFEQCQASGQNYFSAFLLPLFFEGFAKQPTERGDWVARFAPVPYLNGGLFAKHKLERENAQIQIDNAAFKDLLAYFNRYRWYMDERQLRDENEINPDVLGYIFEKYINQKQMGAYYTKEDITEYICKNTILPFIFEATRKQHEVAFDASQQVSHLIANALHGESQTTSLVNTIWHIAQTDPDRYIYEAVKKGVDKPLPPNIEAGIYQVSARGDWNKMAPADYALPTEIWREVVTRRQRCAEVRAKLVNGEVRHINDFITLNLNIRQFTHDVIANCDDGLLLGAIWHNINHVSVLDPTCGSGAFLFAALNILEALYEACLDRMTHLIEQHPNDTRFNDFKRVLREIELHPNRRYFVLKCIIVNNLYGVDMMEEATEICKLRLFLKLIAQVQSAEQIEPLPDIDFNIRAGNTLVGFATRDDVRRTLEFDTSSGAAQGRLLLGDTADRLAAIEDQAKAIDRTFQHFRYLQTQHGIAARDLASAKSELQGKLSHLADQLDRLLAREYGVALDEDGTPSQPNDKGKGKGKLRAPAATALQTNAAYEQWRHSHQPFHWFVEFYGILAKGGFDVIVGNPPWKEYAATKKDYSVIGFTTEKTGNLYSLCIERMLHLRSPLGELSFIVQLPLVSSARMKNVRDLLFENSGHLMLIPCDDRPSKLFEGLEHCRSAIFISTPNINNEKKVMITGYQRWYSEFRFYLFETFIFTMISSSIFFLGNFSKLSSLYAEKIFTKINLNRNLKIEDVIKKKGNCFVFYQEATQYWVKGCLGYPFYAKNSVEGVQPHGRHIYCDTCEEVSVLFSILNSNLFYLYFIVFSDCFHLSEKIVSSFPINLNVLSDFVLEKAGNSLMEDLRRNCERKLIQTRNNDLIAYDEFFASRSKPIIDKIDRILAKHYGFTEEELDYIINYDIKYRMGLAGESGEEE